MKTLEQFKSDILIANINEATQWELTIDRLIDEPQLELRAGDMHFVVNAEWDEDDNKFYLKAQINDLKKKETEYFPKNGRGSEKDILNWAKKDAIPLKPSLLKTMIKKTPKE